MLLVQVKNLTGLTVYEIENGNEVTIAHTVTKEASKWKCSCAKFQLNSQCKHTAGLPEDFEFAGVCYGNEKDQKVDGPIRDIKPEDLGWKVSDVEGHVYRFAPVSQNVHLDLFMKTFIGGGDIRNLGTDAKKSLSRLSRELSQAFLLNEPFENEDVKKKIATDNFVYFTEAEADPNAKAVPSGLVWKDTPRPKNFFVAQTVWECLLWAMATGRHAIMYGPTGCGKSELAYFGADAIKRSIEPINFGAMTEARLSLIGATHFDKVAGTWFNQSRFVRAFIKDEGVILADEITRAPSDAFNILMPALDGQGFIALDESEDGAIVYRGKGVSFIATANIGMEYTGTEKLDRALFDRFKVKIDLDYPEPETEFKILKNRAPDAKKDILKKLADIAKIQRDLANEGEMVTKISTRMVIDCAEMLNDHVGLETAVQHSILECFDKEGGADSERTRVATIFQKEKML